MVRQVLVFYSVFLVVLAVLPAFADTGVMSVVSGKSYQVSYNASGVKVLSMETNPTYDELTIAVQVSSPNASLDLTIPRALLDSKQGTNNIPFITVVDGTLANTEEKNPTATTRTISIQLSPGNRQVEIIGTFVAVSGPSGSSTTAAPLAPSTNSPTTSQNATPTSSATKPQAPASTQTPTSAPETEPAAKPVPQPSLAQKNVTAENKTQNISFTIPYLSNATISLSSVDVAVIGSICLVVIIVIASVVKKPAKKGRTVV